MWLSFGRAQRQAGPHALHPAIAGGCGVMSEEIDRHVMRKYDVAQKLGKGAYGIVWKATDRKSKELC